MRLKLTRSFKPVDQLQWYNTFYYSNMFLSGFAFTVYNEIKNINVFCHVYHKPQVKICILFIFSYTKSQSQWFFKNTFSRAPTSGANVSERGYFDFGTLRGGIQVLLRWKHKSGWRFSWASCTNINGSLVNWIFNVYSALMYHMAPQGILLLV